MEPVGFLPPVIPMFVYHENVSIICDTHYSELLSTIPTD